MSAEANAATRVSKLSLSSESISTASIGAGPSSWRCPLSRRTAWFTAPGGAAQSGDRASASSSSGDDGDRRDDRCQQLRRVRKDILHRLHVSPLLAAARIGAL